MTEYPEVSAKEITHYFRKKPFHQNRLVKLLQGEDKENFKNGLCSGLVIEYGRHYLKYREHDDAPDFMKKLSKKTSKNADERRNFTKRIMLYQRMQFTRHLRSDINLLDLDESSIKKLDDISLLYLSMNSANGPGHAISIRTRPESGNFLKREKYRIFDPNFGEYKANSFKECQRILRKLMGHYGFTTLSSYDLEEFISQNNLAISSSDPDYTKDHKYILNNPKAQNAQQSLFLNSVEANDLKILEELLNIKDLDVNFFTNGYTALHAASFHDYDYVILMLLRRLDLNPNLFNSTGKTALHLAAYNNNADAVTALLTREDLDVNLLSSDGYTALHVALIKNNFDTIKALLTSPNLDVNIKCKNGDIFDILIKSNSPELIKLLIYDGRINPPTLNQINSFADDEVKKLLHAYLYTNKIMEALNTGVRDNNLPQAISLLPEAVKLEFANQLFSRIKKLENLNIDTTSKLTSYLPHDFALYFTKHYRDTTTHSYQQSDSPDTTPYPYMNPLLAIPLPMHLAISSPDRKSQTFEAKIKNVSDALIITMLPLLLLKLLYKLPKTDAREFTKNLDPEHLIEELEQLKSDGTSKADELKNNNIDNKIEKLKTLKEDESIPENEKQSSLKEISRIIKALRKKRENPYICIN